MNLFFSCPWKNNSMRIENMTLKPEAAINKHKYRGHPIKHWGNGVHLSVSFGDILRLLRRVSKNSEFFSKSGKDPVFLLFSFFSIFNFHFDFCSNFSFLSRVFNQTHRKREMIFRTKEPNL